MIERLRNWLQKRTVVEQGTGTGWLSNILAVMAGPQASSGIHMNEPKALTLGPVSTAMRVIGGTFGSLPCHVYRRVEGGGRELAVRHWAYPLLHDSPNEYHTSFSWRELLIAHLLLWGNSYNRIEWLGNGSASALYPLMPWDVTPRLTSGGSKYYQVRLPDGKEDLPDDEVLHVPGLSYDGLKGMSVIGRLRDSLGLAKAAENLAGDFFAKGAKPGWNLQVPGRMSPTAQQNLASSIMERFAGKEAMGVLVTEEGSKLIGPLTMPFKDAEFVQIRQFQRDELLAEFGVPPHLGGASDKQTSWGSGVEQMDIGYAKHTIRPICVRVEQELNRKLFPRGSGLYVSFSMDALMRGDFKTRMEGLQIAVGGPWLTRNEAREIEDWNKSAEEGMDKVLTPLNLGAGAAPKPPEPDAPAPKADDEPADEDDMRGNVTVNVAPPQVNFGESPEARQQREAVERARAESTEQAILALAASQRELAAAVKETKPPQVTVENRVPETPRPIVQVSPEIRNEVRVDVPPAEVNVHLPKRVSESLVERNAEGDITKIKQTEKDA
jgi:HK97 family phage portal protein